MKNITIGGTCGRDAETRQTTNGHSVTSVSVAVNHYDGKENQTIWFDVSMWGKRGEALTQFATKGAKIAFTGDLSTREHNGKTYLQIRADNFTPMSAKRDDSHANSGSSGHQAPAQNDGMPSDSIPF